ncbi:putative serpin-Z12 [Phragmites australis]|uniref:putative serpin-Z12 n=1 Tax=Phragmites australis TaxID=29695 RepID=UPI002D78FFD1|nr:putative serpin-Z12 [Phragmites australis]
MSSRCPAGSPNSTSWRHDDHPAPTHGAGGQSSQLFPVPNVAASIASYLASQPPQPHTNTRRPPVGVDTPLSQHPPRQHSTAALRPWAPGHQHRATPAAPWTWSPTFALPPPPSIPSWTVRPNVMVPGEIHYVASGGGTAGTAGDYAPGCLRVARRAGCKAADKGRNFVLSPLSLHAALALVAAGTNGETRMELLGFLGSASLDKLQHAAATKLVGELSGLPQASFACGVWVDRRWELKPEFAEVAGAVYTAVAESVDFVSQAEQVRQRVNAFVADATKGHIRAVLPPDSVGASTVVVLANALYFKATWAQPFDPSRTFHAPFHLPDGATVRAPFMTSTFEQHVAVFPGFRALKLPYSRKNGNQWRQDACFYMLLLLPDDAARGLGDLYGKAVSTPEFIRKHTPAGKVPVGMLMVPKFKFTFEFEASEDIRQVGVAKAFGGGDFSGMVAGGDGLYITGVYHKATVEVDEEGTVATAATAVSICFCASQGLPVDFVVDRPFLFAVVEERSGAVLFLGHVVNPLAE